MTDFVEYIVSEMKSRRLSRAHALDLIQQFQSRGGKSARAAKLHPLLHCNISDLSAQRFVTTFDGQEAYLCDHVVQGKKVLPGVAYLEMVRAALERAVPERPLDSIIELRNVVWAQPITVERSTAVTLTLFADGDPGRLEYEISSGEGDQPESLHSEGECAFIANPRPPRLDLAALQARMQRGELAAPDLYPVYEKMGVWYGPSHRALTAIQRGERELLARMSLPAAAQQAAADFVLHPSLMDAALQAPLGLLEDIASAPERPMLPFAIESVRILGACTAQMFAWLRHSAAEGSLTRLDIDLADSQGNVCVQMRGITFRELVARADGRQDIDFGALYAVPSWKSESLEAVERAEEPARQIYLVGFERELGEELGRLLPQARCVGVGSGAGRGMAERYGEVAQACLEGIRQVLQDGTQRRTLVQVVIADEARESLLVGLSGMLKSASIENPRVRGQVLQVAADLAASELALRLSAERGVPGDEVIRYEGASRQVLRLRELELSASAPPAFKHRGVYLITGGLGGLGILFAQEILRQADAARIVLTGRAPLDEHKQRQLQALRAQGGNVEYRQLEVTDAREVQQLIDSILAESRELNGIIHAAGVRSDSFLLNKTAAELNSVLAPKVAGALNLDEATRQVELDFLVLFSSGAALMGNAGQADYAAANGFLDQFARYRNELRARGERHGKTLSINWPLWLHGGMQVDADTQKRLLQVSGMAPMRTATGLQAFQHALALDHDQFLLVEGEMQKLRAILFARDEAPANEKTNASASTTPPDAAAGELAEAMQGFLKRVLSTVLRYPANRIDARARFEKYGIDSIMMMNLTQELEKTFGSLAKTLFFEYRSIAELAEHLLRAHPQKVAQLLSPAAQVRKAPAIDVDPGVAAEPGPRAPRARPKRRGFPLSQPEAGASVAVSTDPIAIVGLSGRYPEARNVEDYWRNLREGRDCIREVPASRWDWRRFYNADRGESGHHYSKWGGFIEGVDEFDPRFFGISPREAVLMDPQERLFLQHTWMALEDAGITRAALQAPCADDLPGQVGVYVGVMYSEYQLFGAEALAAGRRMAVPGSYASIANRVSYLLDLHGPSMTVDTMCSSSLTAIHLACQDLKLGRTDIGIAGGVNISIHPAKYLVISAGQFISSDGHCQSFGVGGDGYIPAEGVGTVVLKRLADAVRDGNPIHGVILGSSVNHGGRTNGYSVPNPAAQAGVIRRVLAEARVNPRHVSYVEAHGTGTKLGDPIEIAALTQAFRDGTDDTGFCLIGSAKSNIGHAESAAGIAGLTKVLLQMKHRQIAPSLHSGVLNPHIDFASTPFVVNQSLRSWERPLIEGRDVPRIAGLSSFGAGGSNAHLIIQEWSAPVSERANADVGEGAPRVIPLSARTSGQLEQRARDLRDFLRSFDAPGQKADLAAVARTLQSGRESMDVRLGLLVHSAEELIGKLDAYCNGERDLENLWHGQVKREDPLHQLTDDVDFQATTDRWFANRRYSRLLELWVNGLDLDLSRLHEATKPRCISLPTYPFSQERYWIESPPERAEVAEAMPAKTAASAPAATREVRLRDLTQLSSLAPTVQAAAVSAPKLIDRGAVTRTAAAPALPAPRSAERVLQELQKSLAAALYLDAAEIDPGRQFIDLGLDSIVGVEWIKAINKQFGLDLAAARVYDYPNLKELSRFVVGELAARAEPATAAPVPAAPAPAIVEVAAAPIPRQSVTLANPQTIAAHAGAGSAPRLPPLQPEKPVATPAPLAAPPVSRPAVVVGARHSREELQQQLAVTLAAALYLDVADIDPGKPFVDLGLDSIVGVEWVKVINKQYGLELGAARVYDYPSIRELAAFLVSELKSASPRASIVDTSAPAPVRVEPSAVPVSVPVPAPTAPRDPAADRERTRGKVAIIGMSGRYPGAGDLGRFWQNLSEGRNSVAEIPRSRWDVDRYYDADPRKPGKIYCKWLGALDEIDRFDPLFFQITPAEAELMDPQHRLFLQESYKAFEDAGYSPSALSNVKCGVYLGIMSNEYAFLSYGASSASIPVTGNSFAIGAARIAYFLNLKGPAIPIDTACSSSLVAVHLACQALLNRETDMALAGGATLYLIPESYLGMCQAGMLSPQGQCKTFDDSANGFVPGEGVGALVLKRLEDAERDNDPIYGVILGSAINQDGKTNGITAPSVNSQIQLERDLYARCGIHPETISYVETHGTGTKLGDPIELEALATVFQEKTARKNFCGLGSVKSNIGHTSAAAGVASIQKVLLSMQHRSLVPTLHVEKENSLFDFANSPFYIARHKQPWSSGSDTARRAAVSSFGFSGTNAHLVLEEYCPPGQTRARAPAPPRAEVILLSAKSTAQLRRKAGDLVDYLRTGSADLELAALAYTLQVGRESMKERLGLIVRSGAELIEKLEAYLDGATPEGLVQGRAAFGGGATSARFATEEALAAAVETWIEQQQLSSLLELWVGGGDVDWVKLHGDEKPRCLRLPTYPFAQERYWISAPAKTQPAREPVTASASAQTLCYVPKWRAAAAPTLPEGAGARGPVLVLDGSVGLRNALRAHPGRSGGDPVVQVRFSEQFEKIDATDFTIDPRRDEHFVRLVTELEAAGLCPRWVVHVAPAGDVALDDALDRGVGAIFRLSRALLGGSSRAVDFLTLCVQGAGRAEPLAAALAGFYQTLAQENPRLRGKVMALPAGVTEQSVAALVCNEREPLGNHTEIRYVRDAGNDTLLRYAREWVEWSPDHQSLAQVPIRQGGVYVISGGLGGLGFIFSEYLARNFGARLVLLGRSAPDAGITRKLEHLRSCNAQVVYLQADVTDAADVRNAIGAAKARFARIDGVIHGAGITRDAFILKKTTAELDAVVRPKVHGAVHLDEATRDEPLDFFLLFSSVAAVAGNAGQGDYAYANRFLDAFAEYREQRSARRERHGRTLSINWPYWRDGGMSLAADDIELMRTRTGMHPLPTEDGIRCWEELAKSSLTQGAVLYGAAEQIRARFATRSSAVAPVVRADEPLSTESDVQGLLVKTQAYLKVLIGENIKLAPGRIDSHERLESFGIDSIVIGRINLRLEADFGELPKTLFYEHESIVDLADYLVRERRDVLLALFAEPAREPPAARLEGTAPGDTEVQAPARQTQVEPIAIVGHHGLYPKSPDLASFWENLRDGRDLVDLVPRNRWDCEEYFDADPERAAQGKIYCKWGGFLEDFDKFDAAFFSIAPAEARLIDPQERLFLQSVWSAFEDAGYTRERLKKLHPRAKSAAVGVFVGVTTNSYQLLGIEERLHGQTVNPVSMPWSIANRVSYFFDLQGPSLAVDTACSSSLVAVHLACESLMRGDCEVAVAGGVNLYPHPQKYQSLCERRMVSRDGKTHSFGAHEDGFVPAEGVGSLILKPLSKALADGDRIHALIRASGSGHSGRANGYSAPNPNSTATLIAETLRKAQVSPETIGYVEGHGTGTQLGDSLEVVALSNAFRGQTSRKQFCALGSVKSNIGHPEAAAGVAGISKILLQFEHAELVPTLHSAEPNPDIEFADSPFYLQHSLTKWEGGAGHPRRALINSFGSGGVAACVVLEEYRSQSTASPTDEGPYLLVLSARNPQRLEQYVETLLASLGRESADLADLCYTLQTGREAMPERLAIVAGDRAELEERLEAVRRGEQPAGVHRTSGTADVSPGDSPVPEAAITPEDLQQLAATWVRGTSVPWQTLRRRAVPRRISAPSYPFARERHWIGDASPRGAARPEPAQLLHPLIGYNCSTFSEVSFRSTLSEREYYAEEHKVHGRKLFPGSCFIEMACVAGNMVGGAKVRRLEDVVWVQPLGLEGDGTHVQIALKPLAGDEAEFVVTSRDADDGIRVHSEGKLCFEAGARAPTAQADRLDIPALERGCTKLLLPAEYYALARDYGFDYGPAFRTIARLHIADSYALSRLELADHLRAGFEHYILHPCLLDGALQTVSGLAGSLEPSVPFIPFAIGEVEIFRAIPEVCYVHVERATGGQRESADIRKFNIRIATEGGYVVVNIRDFCVRALAAPAHAAQTPLPAAR